MRKKKYNETAGRPVVQVREKKKEKYKRKKKTNTGLENGGGVFSHFQPHVSFFLKFGGKDWGKKWGQKLKIYASKGVVRERVFAPNYDRNPTRENPNR